MKIEAYIAKLKRDREILANAVPSMCEEIAESSLTLLKDRSINEGIAIDGVESNKAEYSTRPTRTEKFRGKELNRSGTNYIESNMLGTWHGFRKAQGLNSEKVNLSYTNQMWENIRILKSQKTAEGKAQTIVGSYDAETNKKMSSNEFRFGDFLRPTDEEIELAQEVLQEKIIKLLRQ